MINLNKEFNKVFVRRDYSICQHFYNPSIWKKKNIYKFIVVCVPSDGDYVVLERILAIQHDSDENFERLVKRKLKYLCAQDLLRDDYFGLLIFQHQGR